MKAARKLFCLAGGLIFFVLLVPVQQSACAAVQDPRQASAADTILLAQEQPAPAPAGEPQKAEQSAQTEKKRTKHPILMYLPNRIFDLLDILRVRVRVGPGISAGVRATRPLSVFAGFHSSIFAGLPGPRGETKFPWPVGFDSRTGVQASVIDFSTRGIYYDPLEVGFELQPLIVGLNFGIGVFEILDFATGILFIDLQGDDF